MIDLVWFQETYGMLVWPNTLLGCYAEKTYLVNHFQVHLVGKRMHGEESGEYWSETIGICPFKAQHQDKK
jgi:hypothetical protein